MHQSTTSLGILCAFNVVFRNDFASHVELTESAVHFNGHLHLTTFDVQLGGVRELALVGVYLGQKQLQE
jgi:hypothetical protein